MDKNSASGRNRYIQDVFFHGLCAKTEYMTLVTFFKKEKPHGEADLADFCTLLTLRFAP